MTIFDSKESNEEMKRIAQAKKAERQAARDKAVAKEDAKAAYAQRAAALAEKQANDIRKSIPKS